MLVKIQCNFVRASLFFIARLTTTTVCIIVRRSAWAQFRPTGYWPADGVTKHALRIENLEQGYLGQSEFVRLDFLQCVRIQRPFGDRTLGSGNESDSGKADVVGYCVIDADNKAS